MILNILKNTAFLSQVKSSTLFTGIQPTGQLHIGNYLGSITNMLRLQQSSQYDHKFLMIADYHSLTTSIKNLHSKITYNDLIGEDTFTMAKILLASGVDPKKMCMFVQSQTSAHCELTWIFNCLVPQYWLNTMIQYKEKAHENSSIGLYTYPILMAVDILLYRANHVPVGVDQLQHLQLTNKIVKRFNKLFRNEYFPHVKYVQSKFPKIMSLADPSKKMSKSDKNKKSRITLADDKNDVYVKIKRAVTDSEGNFISFDPVNRPGLSNLIQIYSAFSGEEIDNLVEDFQKNKTSIAEFKEKLTSMIVKRLSEIQTNLKEQNDEEVRKILVEGSQYARQVGESNLQQIKKLLSIYK